MGREVILKATVQAIPTYSMSCFKLTQTLCHELETMIRKFWWGQRGERKIYWIKWSKLCRPKNEGGMDFRDLLKFNDAMLAKQFWHLLSNQDSLFYRFFKENFFPHGTIFGAKENRGSFAWKSMLKGRDIIRKVLRWRIGDGSCVRIFQDNWLPESQSGRVLSPVGNIPPSATVSTFIDHNLRGWKANEIDRNFLPSETAIIKVIPLSFSVSADSIYWPKTPDGIYSVKSGYKLLLEETTKT